MSATAIPTTSTRPSWWPTTATPYHPPLTVAPPSGPAPDAPEGFQPPHWYEPANTTNDRYWWQDDDTTSPDVVPGGAPEYSVNPVP